RRRAIVKKPPTLPCSFDFLEVLTGSRLEANDAVCYREHGRHTLRPPQPIISEALIIKPNEAATLIVCRKILLQNGGSSVWVESGLYFLGIPGDAEGDRILAPRQQHGCGKGNGKNHHPRALCVNSASLRFSSYSVMVRIHVAQDITKA